MSVNKLLAKFKSLLVSLTIRDVSTFVYFFLYLKHHLQLVNNNIRLKNFIKLHRNKKSIDTLTGFNLSYFEGWKFIFVLCTDCVIMYLLEF